MVQERDWLKPPPAREPRDPHLRSTWLSPWHSSTWPQLWRMQAPPEICNGNKVGGGDLTKLTTWKLKATASPGLQFFAYMQPGEAFLLVGHSMATVYSTTADIASFHGNVVLFTGDRKGTCECIPVILLPQSAFEWKKCSVIDDKEKLFLWYADNPLEYGKLCNPTANYGPKVELHVPRMIGLPLQVTSFYHQLRGAVMLHELLDTVEKHLANPATSLDNGDNWGLVQKWLLVAAQKDGSGGDPAKSKSFIAFCMDALLSNNDLIHWWMTEMLNATLGRHPENASTKVGIQGNMAVVQNMSGIIATEVGCGLGVVNAS